MYWLGSVVFAICAALVTATGLSGKALFCRDPDTGKLHGINSTWASNSFCGNYRCVIRYKNITAMENVLLRQINITDVNLNTTTKPKAADNSGANSVTIETRVKPDIQPLFHKEIVAYGKNAIDDTTKNNNEDRYLTEDEIKSISKMLHNVKKSDLDAIVDIYNLAQDIYKEMDKATTDEIVDETINTINTMRDEKWKMKTNRKPSGYRNPSYWYEPLDSNFQKKASDLENQGSNVVNKVASPKNEPKSASFNGGDLYKLPYYYPITNFQRYASYVHSPPNQKSSCSQRKDHTMIDTILKKPMLEQRVIQPSVLLPYPFSYIHHYNSSDNMNKMFRGTNPWAFFDYYNNRPYRPYPVYAYPSNMALMNPHLGKNIADEDQNSVSKELNILDSLITKAKENKLPEWQTPPLSAKVLEEVKANIDNLKLLKPLPLRKRVALEKVGKVIKLEEFVRSKRETDQEVKVSTDDSSMVYEVYLETVTCQADTDTKPGFFRMGNLNEPFPDCCPKRIEEPERETTE